MSLKRLRFSLVVAAAVAMTSASSLSASVASAAPTPLPANAIAHVATAPPPFMTWTIVSNKGVQTGHLGKNETQLRTAENTMFHVASVTKTVVAASIMRLVQQGKLKLTDKISALLPDATSADPRWQVLTVEHLLSHTSGLKDYENNGYQKPVRDWTQAFDGFRTGAAIEFSRDPAQEFAYTNKNFDILAAIIDKASGIGFSPFVKQQILSPNGAPNAQLSCYDAPSGALVPGYGVSVSGELTGNFYKPFSKARAGAGGMCISSKELAVWARNIFDCKRPNATLTCSSIAEMRRVRKEPYGLGLFVEKIGQVDTIGHDGGDVGYGASLLYAPEAGISVAVTTNYVLAQPEVVAEMLLARELDIAYPNPSKLKPLQSYEGFYFNKDRDTCVRVSRDSGQLFIEYQDVDYPYAVTKFRIPSAPAAGIFQGPYPGGKLAHILETNGTPYVQFWQEYPQRKVDRYNRTAEPMNDCSGWF